MHGLYVCIALTCTAAAVCLHGHGTLAQGEDKLSDGSWQLPSIHAMQLIWRSQFLGHALSSYSPLYFSDINIVELALPLGYTVVCNLYVSILYSVSILCACILHGYDLYLSSSQLHITGGCTPVVQVRRKTC